MRSGEQDDAVDVRLIEQVRRHQSHISAVTVADEMDPVIRPAFLLDSSGQTLSSGDSVEMPVLAGPLVGPDFAIAPKSGAEGIRERASGAPPSIRTEKQAVPPCVNIGSVDEVDDIGRTVHFPRPDK
jgi:hypothetical protein